MARLASFSLQSAFRAGSALCTLAGGLALGQPVRAAEHAQLAVVKPVMSCAQLATTGFAGATDAPTTVLTAKVEETDQGSFCRVQGLVAPAIAFTVDLPMERWTQRFLENAMGRQTPSFAGGCAPATRGEFVVASEHPTSAVKQTDEAWTSDMQQRIDFAYRGNHQTAVVAKVLIRAFYGQPQKYSYFMGCSEGGREALTEAQRFPEDFDGITAGAPVALDSIHNVFFHPWEDHVNRRADGSRILAKDRLGVLHDAVIAHCGKAAGVIDGMLQQPDACRFDPKWVLCQSGQADPSLCLSAEEVAVAARLYEGPSDVRGHKLELGGLPPGGEMFWKLSTAQEYGDRETKEGFAMRRLFLPPDGEKTAAQLDAEFAYDQAVYEKTKPLASLYNAANTNLGPFQQHGGKLILWHGAADLVVQPGVSLAYYQGVRKQLGASLTDQFMRYFLVPGLGHCQGGEGAGQIDLLSELMAWTEMRQPPARLVAGKVAQAGPRPEGGQAVPFASPAAPTLYTRAIFPFPAVAHFAGGDPKNAENYVSIPGPMKVPQTFDSQAAALIGPDNQKVWRVANGRLVASKP